MKQPLAWLGLVLMMITRPEILENYPKGDINAGHDILVFRYHNVRICQLISLRVLLIYEIRTYLFALVLIFFDQESMDFKYKFY